MRKILLRAYILIFSRPSFFKLNKFIYMLSLHGLGVFNYHSSKLSGEKRFLSRLLKNQPAESIVIDIGANLGQYSQLCLETNPGIRLLSFEPHPRTFLQLKKAFDVDKIELFNEAVGSTSQTIELFDYKNSDGSSHASIYKEVFESIHRAPTSTHTVKCTTLDHIVRNLGIDRICLLKIDVEGHELEVLKGARNALSSGIIETIHFEFNEMNIASRSFMIDFIRILNNYKLYRLLPNGELEIEQYRPITTEIFAYQNIVAYLKSSSLPSSQNRGI